MNNYDKLVNVLREIFLLDQPDLDFGIFRIMNQKRKDIEFYLNKELVPQAKEVLLKSGSVNSEETKAELEKLSSTLKAAGINPDDSPKVKELKAKLKTDVDLDGLENEVFSHLAAFFKRYYDKGDFISMRRYKKDVYAIPYEGEEVKLHWANHDQYYIKSSEYLKNYAFILPTGQKVQFMLVEATTEMNNNKAQGNQDRRFALNHEKVLEVKGNELEIYFTYDLMDKCVKQKNLHDEALEVIEKELPSEFISLLTLAPTEKDKQRTLLAKHLNDYTARNTFDYFIHKDLGGFLRRELDFYIKNEVLFIDDLNTRNEKDVLKSLSIIKAIKQIGDKVITFLAQIENFQKKLWLKKKFVIDINYCITLDKIPENYYEEIGYNREQLDEWKRLFAIDKIKSDAFTLVYSEPVSVDFLKQNPFLVLDTKFFSEEFKEKVLATFDDLDDELNGILINSDNFHALCLLQERYKKQINSVYIDPPYNAKSSEILYKNSFKHSSWLTLIQDRVQISLPLLKEDFVYVTAIDEVENVRLELMYKEIFPDCEDSCISIVHNPTGQQGNNFSFTHEYAHFIFPANKKCIGLEDRDDDKRESMPDIRPLRNVSSGKNHLRESAANCFYPIFIKNGKIIGFGNVCSNDFHPGSINIKRNDGTIEVYPIDPSDVESKWVFERNTVESIKDELTAEYNQKKKIWDIIRKKSKFRYKSLWTDKRYSANSWGSVILNNMIPDNPFDYPKSIYNVRDCIDASLNNQTEGIIIDFFGGSGTTGHATIMLNREDDGNRNYIIVEMGEYFESVTKPRIQKIIYSEGWKDGKPTNRKGSSHMFKYFSLESYEDVLNNLDLKRDATQEGIFGKGGTFTEDYILSYMLDVEAEGSLLSAETFTNPFDYKLNITRNNQTSYTKVDLVETFNYLIGLHVQTTERIRGFKVVTGKNRDDEMVLVIWRNLNEKSNKDLDDFFLKQNYNTRDSEFDRIFVNGDNNLENLKVGDEKWKVALIEEEFKKRMFDVKDI